MNYREEKDVTKAYKQEYVDGFERLIQRREKECVAQRDKLDLFEKKEENRTAFLKMLGWPLGVLPPVAPEPQQELLADEEDMLVYRMRFAILPEVTMTGLFFKHKTDKVLPFSLVSHGGLGSPEFIGGVYGYTGNYNDMLMRVFNEGINCFSPQLLIWGSNDYGVDYNRQSIDARLKRVGSSVTAIELFGFQCALSYFEKQSYVGKIGMVGLSYGGFYTLFTAAADTRIQAALSCSFFNDRSVYPWPDWTWTDAALTYSDAEIACLIHPRKLWIRIGDKDELFDAPPGEHEYARIEALCQNVGTDWVDFKVFEGVHEFIKDDETMKAYCDELKK